jgi:hypothetical protein
MKLFESKEYHFLDEPTLQSFFNDRDNCLYQIQENSKQDILNNKGELSLWNLTREKRISGLYKQKGIRASVYKFDWLGQVYYLELMDYGILVEFLYLKESFPTQRKTPKEHRKSRHNSQKRVSGGGLW